MAKKNYQQAGKNIAGEIKQRSISEFLGRVSNVLSQSTNTIAQIVPPPIRNWLTVIANEFNKEEKSDSPIEGVKPDLENEQTPSFKQIPDQIQKIYPPLKIDKEIRGKYGTYQIIKFIDKFNAGSLEDRPDRYFYKAIQLPNSEPIIIEEFLFPKPEKERDKQKKAEIEQKLQYLQYNFERFSGLELADGKIQDFRVITPDEAIFDYHENRYYLVFKNSLYSEDSLGSYIKKREREIGNGAMNNIEVYQVLNQVLQSLQFLHTQKFLLPGGNLHQDKYHGNLTLDSLVIVPSFQGSLIYLRDLSLWEHQYKNIRNENLKKEYSPEKDIQDLGKIGLYLLAGNIANDINDLKLPNTVNGKLKEFLFKLVNNEFISAEKARQNLPNFQDIAQETKPDEQEKPQPDIPHIKNVINWQFILFGSLGIVLLMVIFGLLTINKNRENKQNKTMTTLERVTGIPQGKFTYTSPETPDGIWRYVLTTKKLIPGGDSLENYFTQILPSVQLTYIKPTQLDNIIRLKNGEIDFAISTIAADNKNSELGYEEFAYDGLAVFVAFSKQGRKDSLPTALQGKITLEQLQKIYTAEITNWKDIPGINGPNLPIKLYISRNAEAVKNFEQRILKTEENISKFRRLLTEQNTTQDNNGNQKNQPKVNKLETFKTFRSIIQDFENVDSNNQRIGSIGFDSLSKAYGQCSIYPLALQDGNKPAISPLIQLNGEPINPQETDLCNKSSYVTNSQQFINQKYPLAYPLSVVYLRDNRQEAKGAKFAEVLKSKEIQCLLKHTGLVTLQPLNNSRDCTTNQ